MPKPVWPPREEKMRSRPLSEEERALWDKVVQGITPLHGRARRPKNTPPPEEALKGPPPRGAVHVVAPPQRRTSPKGAAPPAANGAAKLPPLKTDLKTEIADPCRRTVRRLGKGAIPIDRRLDLHGLDEARAHTALRAFLLSAHAQGARWVLIITGKGQRPRAVPGGSAHLLYPREPGVLRRNVPRWLAEPDLRPLVAEYGEASPVHGGGGALYVRLRRSG